MVFDNFHIELCDPITMQLVATFQSKFQYILDFHVTHEYLLYLQSKKGKLESINKVGILKMTYFMHF